MRKLKFIIIPVLLLTALVLIGASCGEKETRKKDRDKEEPEQEENYLTFENTKWKFEIDYPEDWEKEIIAEEPDGVAVAFITPEEGPTDDFQEYIIVVAAEPNPYEDFDELMGEAIREFPEQEDMDLIDSSKVIIAGYLSYKLIYTQIEYESELQYLHYFLDSGDVWYQILYIAKKSQYPKYLEQVETVINSFEVF